MGRTTPEVERVKAWRRRVRSRWLRLAGRAEDATYWLVRSLPGMLPKDQVRLLYRTVASEPGPGDIAEVGSWMGKSTVTMARALLDARRDDCRVYAIDHHQGSDQLEPVVAEKGSSLGPFRRHLRLGGVEALVEPLVMPAAEGAAELARRGVVLRLVFIDGGHEEQPVRQDIRSFRPLMKPRGLMAFHDCDPEGGRYPGVWTALESELLRGAADVVDHAGVLWIVRLRD